MMYATHMRLADGAGESVGAVLDGVDTNKPYGSTSDSHTCQAGYSDME